MSEENEVIESMKDYEKELENSFRVINEGDIITGTVIDVTEEEITVDLNYYTQGIIKAEDVSDDPCFSMLDKIRINDPITAEVVKLDDGNGSILLSRKKADQILSWDVVKEIKESEKIVEVKVAQAVNGGVIAYLEGLRAFIPASQLALSYVEDTASFVGKTLKVKITEVNRNSERLTLSAKEVLKEQEAENHSHKVAMIVPGVIVDGVVESLQPYGAFIDIGDGLSGLCHISQISEFRIKKPSEILKVGDKVKVKILNTNDGKISLSIKEANEVTEDENSEIIKEAEEFLDKSTTGTSLGDLLKCIKLD